MSDGFVWQGFILKISIKEPLFDEIDTIDEKNIAPTKKPKYVIPESKCKQGYYVYRPRLFWDFFRFISKFCFENFKPKPVQEIVTNNAKESNSS